MVPSSSVGCAGDLIDEIYYTVGGSRAGEGAVLARSRNGTADLWRLNVSEPDGWYRLETNYDRLNPVGAVRKLNCRVCPADSSRPQPILEPTRDR